MTGDTTKFPKKFVARVAVSAWDINVDGSATGALGDADYGKKIRPSPEGKANIVSVNGAQAAIAALATSYKATLAANGDFNVAVVSSQLSLVFHQAISGNNLTNINNSDVGRRFTIGTGATASVYAFVSSYVSGSKSIPVSHVSGPTTFSDGTLNLALEAQAQSVGRVVGGTKENLRLAFDLRDNFR